jgi:acyl-CoA thioester hydrolase
MAAVQQNITYRSELLVGETLAIRSAFLEVREKVARFVHEMRNAVTGEISAICVLTGVHTDSQTRRSCPFPPEIAERARKLVRAYELPN